MGGTLEGSKEKIIFKRNPREREETRLILIYYSRYLSAKGYSHGTIDHHRCGLIKYIDFLKENRIYSFDQVNESSFENYSAYLKKEGFKVKSILYKLDVIKMFYRFMFSEGYINKDIYDLMRLYQEINFPIKYRGRIISNWRKKSTLKCLKGFLRDEEIKTTALLAGTPTKLLCKDCVDFIGANIFIRGCYGKRFKECEHKVNLLKVI